MKTWKITHKEVYDESRKFLGTRITAEYLDKQLDEIRDLSFFYDFQTKNPKGLVDKVLQYRINGYGNPENVSDVRTSKYRHLKMVHSVSFQ